jgi:hypothetical protein
MSNYATGSNSGTIQRDADGNLYLRVGLTGDQQPLEVTFVQGANLKITPILITAGNANTEIQHTLSQNVRRIIMQVTGTDGENQHATLRVSFVANGTLDSGANAREYILVTPGSFLDLTDLNLESYSVYFQCNKQDRAVKILEYT